VKRGASGIVTAARCRISAEGKFTKFMVPRGFREGADVRDAWDAGIQIAAW
jgi:hypothetical protein